jgi:hypothetical protein
MRRQAFSKNKAGCVGTPRAQTDVADFIVGPEMDPVLSPTSLAHRGLQNHKTKIPFCQIKLSTELKRAPAVPFSLATTWVMLAPVTLAGVGLLLRLSPGVGFFCLLVLHHVTVITDLPLA